MLVSPVSINPVTPHLTKWYISLNSFIVGLFCLFLIDDSKFVATIIALFSFFKAYNIFSWTIGTFNIPTSAVKSPLAITIPSNSLATSLILFIPSLVSILPQSLGIT